MTEPLRLTFEVACAADHAFAVWTERIGTWWPAGHTVSGAPEAVVLQGWVGGRVYERTTQGVEHDWGVLTKWEPPVFLAFRWHLGVEPESATDVHVSFSPLDGGGTLIEIEQSGWDRVGAAASQLRGRNEVGWNSLVPHVRAAMENGAGDGNRNQR